MGTLSLHDLRARMRIRDVNTHTHARGMSDFKMIKEIVSGDMVHT